MANPLLKSVCRAMERVAPLRLAESWDNVRPSSKILRDDSIFLSITGRLAAG